MAATTTAPTPSPLAIPPPGERNAKQIRADVVRQRQELAGSVAALRHRVAEITDVKRQVREHRNELILGAAIAGALVGGVIALKRRNGA